MNSSQHVVEEFKEQFFTEFEQGHFTDIAVLLSKLDVVQEQPQLLDEHLQSLVDPIIKHLLKNLQPQPIARFSADLYQTLYCFSKIRGSKVLVKFLPNDVHVLIPLLCWLEAQDFSDDSTWQARYIVLLWLSLICMAPFDLKAFDQDNQKITREHIQLVDRILPLAERCLGVSNKEREAAGLLIARVLTRKDINQTYVPEFLQRSLSKWNSQTVTSQYRTGLLTCLCEIYKIGNRDVLLSHVDATLSIVREMDESGELRESTLLRKLRIKLAQRLALSQQKPNLASWRYRNDPKSLDYDIPVIVDEDVEEETPSLVEEVVGLLLESLCDRDTVVRYSAAKGVGRVTSRLPLSYAEDIIDAILGMLDDETQQITSKTRLRDTARESTWHGCCLAIAELCRAGGLVPAVLPRIFSLMFIAIKFDIRKGSHSIGTSVRDAACYVMWSVLRCYKTEILSPFLTEIATSLIVVAMFDREVSVRRAASAAFQEGVGRHPESAIPFGISVLSDADFQAVGQRRVSFLEVSLSVFQYEPYRASILDYLGGISTFHWDRNVRELAGQTLGLIMTSILKMMPDLTLRYLVDECISSLWKQVTSIDTAARHGAYYALGEISQSLYEFAQRTQNGNVDLRNWISLVKSADGMVPEHNFKGPNAALMYCGVCHYIARYTCLETLATKFGREESSLPSRLQHCYQICCQSFSLSTELVREEASNALCSLFEFSLVADMIADQIVKLPILNNSQQKGWSLLCGKLTYAKRNELLVAVVQQLTHLASIQGDVTRDDPELRSIATRSLSKLVNQISTLQSIPGLLETMVVCVSRGFDDYTLDARGDVGSWIREAAVEGACQVFRHACHVESKMLINMLRSALTQCLGKIDNLREFAVHQLHDALHDISWPTESGQHTEFMTTCMKVLPILSNAESCLKNGHPSSDLFKNLVDLLNLPFLEKSLLTEYLISGASGSQSTMKSASSALQDYLLDAQATTTFIVLQHIVDIIREHTQDEKKLIPILQSTADLLESEVFAATQSDLDDLFSVIQSSTLKTRSMPKVMAALKCYAALALTTQEVRYKAWKKLALTLNHKYPRVRVFAAELLYSVLSTLDLENHDNKQLVSVLTETHWADAVDSELVCIVKQFVLP